MIYKFNKKLISPKILDFVDNNLPFNIKKEELALTRSQIIIDVEIFNIYGDICKDNFPFSHNIENVPFSITHRKTNDVTSTQLNISIQKKEECLKDKSYLKFYEGVFLNYILNMDNKFLESFKLINIGHKGNCVDVSFEMLSEKENLLPCFQKEYLIEMIDFCSYFFNQENGTNVDPLDLNNIIDIRDYLVNDYFKNKLINYNLIREQIKSSIYPLYKNDNNVVNVEDFKNLFELQHLQ